MATEDCDAAPFTPAGPRFWRHVVLIAACLLLRGHPEDFDWQAAAGYWASGLVICFGAAAVITALSLLFATSVVRRHLWPTFVALAWLFALLLVAGQWVARRELGVQASDPARYFTPNE